MTGPTDIRPAGQRDIPRIKAIAEATDLFPADMVEGMMSGYLDGASRDIWLVCGREDRVVAFGFCEPERMTEGTWNLLAIAVLPPHQGNGIGAAMLAHLEARLAGDGQRVLLVETMGTPAFARTRSFYVRNNYVEEARIRDFYAVGADKVVYWKKV